MALGDCMIRLGFLALSGLLLVASSTLAGERAGVLLGAVLGGFLEFFSMVIGFKAMTLVAVVSYLAAFLIREKKKVQIADAPRRASSDPALSHS